MQLTILQLLIAAMGEMAALAKGAGPIDAANQMSGKRLQVGEGVFDLAMPHSNASLLVFRLHRRQAKQQAAQLCKLALKARPLLRCVSQMSLCRRPAELAGQRFGSFSLVAVLYFAWGETHPLEARL